MVKIRFSPCSAAEFRACRSSPSAPWAQSEATPRPVATSVASGKIETGKPHICWENSRGFRLRLSNPLIQPEFCLKMDLETGSEENKITNSIYNITSQSEEFEPGHLGSQRTTKKMHLH